MVNYKFSCPNCGQRIQVDSRQACIQSHCPNCKNEIIVPPPPEATGSSEPRESLPYESSRDQEGSSGNSAESFQPRETIIGNLMKFGGAAVHETKRKVKFASLKAKLLKLNQVDLPKAHYELGRQCYENGCFQEEFAAEYKELNDLSQAIHDKRQTITTPEHATAGERIKVGAQNAAAKASAETLALKFKKLFTQLGELVEQQESQPTEIIGSLDAVRLEIGNLKNQLARLSDGDPARNGLELIYFKRKQVLISIAIVVVLIVVGSFSYIRHQKFKVKNENAQQARQRDLQNEDLYHRRTEPERLDSLPGYQSAVAYVEQYAREHDTNISEDRARSWAGIALENTERLEQHMGTEYIRSDGGRKQEFQNQVHLIFYNAGLVGAEP